MSAAPTPITPEAAAAFNAANAAFREGRFDAALDAATRAAQLAPDLAIAHVLKARALRRLGDEPAAWAAYDAALATDPASFDALLERGNVLRGLGEAAEAAVSYSRAKVARPLDARPALALARLWEEQPGQDAAEKAAIAFQRALDRAGAGAEPAPAMAGLCYDIARFRLERADLPRALEARLLAVSSVRQHVFLTARV